MTVLKKYPRNQHGEEFLLLANKINKDGWGISEANERQITDINDGDEEDEASFSNIENTQDLFCFIEKPRGANYKFWGVKCKKNNLGNVIGLATQLKKSGATNIYICTVQSENFPQFPITDNTLKGVGGMNMTAVVNAVSGIINEKLTIRNFKIIKQQML
jgi:hypothetical protein